jgi:hypothetical protein
MACDGVVCGSVEIRSGVVGNGRRRKLIIVEYFSIGFVSFEVLRLFVTALISHMMFNKVIKFMIFF